ncbi:MAG: 2-oxoacid:acceptor oxidoreductase subunit alpha [Roseovarius sp.]
MTEPRRPKKSVSLAVVGSGGAGALTAGTIVLEAAGKNGWYGMMNRSVGPQIRGGEAGALLRLANHPVDCMNAEYDLLVAIDWKNVERFWTAMPVRAGGIVIADPALGEVPEIVARSGAEIRMVPIKELAAAVKGGRENMIAAGIMAQLIELSEEALAEIVRSRLGAKGEEAVANSLACARAGMEAAAGLGFGDRLHIGEAYQKEQGRWLITGNEAVGLGALRGGVRFAAGYPITPATEVLEWLAAALPEAGGTLVQAEDELASANMILGASFGGRPAITATSGPGLSLMMETLGLAVASEIPLVVVDVMRCGPSTGIATKSEQSDLNIAIHGFHGDAPHVVVAPISVADCLYTAQWAVYLAEAMQTPVILLSDQALGQARVVMKRPANLSFVGRRKTYAGPVGEERYLRYAITADGVSEMAIPGTTGGQHTADGLTHSVSGAPSTSAADQQQQMDKRRRKIEEFDYGVHWGETFGDGETVILTWGSLTAPAREAQRRLAEEGIAVRVVAPRLLSPFPREGMRAALAGARRVLIVEQSHGGQFHTYLRAQIDLPGEQRHFHRPGPHLIGAREITQQIKDWVKP